MHFGAGISVSGVATSAVKREGGGTSVLQNAQFSSMLQTLNITQEDMDNLQHHLSDFQKAAYQVAQRGMSGLGGGIAPPPQQPAPPGHVLQSAHVANTPDFLSPALMPAGTQAPAAPMSPSVGMMAGQKRPRDAAENFGSFADSIGISHMLDIGSLSIPDTPKSARGQMVLAQLLHKATENGYVRCPAPFGYTLASSFPDPLACLFLPSTGGYQPRSPLFRG